MQGTQAHADLEVGHERALGEPMTIDDSSKDPDHLVHVRADAAGVELTISKSASSLIARLLPTKFRLRRGIDDAIGERLLHKIRANQAFDEAEEAFAEAVLSEQAKKYVRLKRLTDRAVELLPRVEVLALPPRSGAPDSTPELPTSDDWVNKFREDASLVDDELIREVYARALCEEAQRPGTFSLRTLGVLRYLDRDVAVAFGKIQKVLMNGFLVPQQVAGTEDHVLAKAGLNHVTMLALDDAGLLNAKAQSQHTNTGKLVYLVLDGHGPQVIAARKSDGTDVTLSLKVHLLTPAGRQLACIAEAEPDGSVLDALVAWLRPHLAGCELSVATMPSRQWTGQAGELTWHPL